ncbi:hypothetical protein pdam_00002819 [Pocillopora damicornis]|uniref:Uncharacterized protein n=1 Tax=Pocillopora damicornis TaxID=46731 RepID=A0A3M6U8V6_POCDA|nr:hypothetical protein pdam_00002819 [Pocillopora damicornis]
MFNGNLGCRWLAVDVYLSASRFDSDDSDDEIIEKTREQFHSTTQGEQEKVINLDPKNYMRDFQSCSENSSVSNGTTAFGGFTHLQDESDVRKNENFLVNGDCGGERDTGEEEVFEKVRRGRLDFPVRSEIDSAPIERRILAEDRKDKMNQNPSKESKRNKSSCSLN